MLKSSVWIGQDPFRDTTIDTNVKMNIKISSLCNSNEQTYQSTDTVLEYQQAGITGLNWNEKAGLYVQRSSHKSKHTWTHRQCPILHLARFTESLPDNNKVGVNLITAVEKVSWAQATCLGYAHPPIQKYVQPLRAKMSCPLSHQHNIVMGQLITKSKLHVNENTPALVHLLCVTTPSQLSPENLSLILVKTQANDQHLICLIYCRMLW